MPVLCIDPGFRALGLVIYHPETDSIMDYGLLLSDANEYKAAKKSMGSSKADAMFLEAVGSYLSKYTKKYAIKQVIVELPHGSKSFRAATMLGKVSGAIIGWATALNKPLTYYTPERNKKCVTGDSYAAKELVEVAVRKRWPSPFWAELTDKEREHVCDAAGLIITAQAHGDI